MRKILIILLLAAGCLMLGFAGLSLWTGEGPIADALRVLPGNGAKAVVRPEDVPSCGPHWRVSASQNPSSEYNELHAVSASSPKDVWAVGTYGTEEYALTLIERWDGTDWTHVHSPGVPSYSNHLYGVTAISEGDAWAVGASHRGTDVWQTLAMRWDGTRWGLTPSPNTAPISVLNATAATSTDDVWAVGEQSKGTKGSGSQTLILHWDGLEWSVAPSPNVEQSGALNAVVALAKDDAWAAGVYTDRSGDLLRPLVLHWDGKVWSVVENPGTGTVWGMAAVSAQEVWAVGNNGPQTLTMRRRGGAWQVVPSPNPGTGSNSLNGVAASSRGDVWAVGSQGKAGVDRTLAMHWGGERWDVAPSPSAGDYVDELFGVVATTSGDAWAAGSYTANATGANLTMVQRYADPCGE